MGGGGRVKGVEGLYIIKIFNFYLFNENKV
jgi:hypothetical protein